MLEFDIKNHKVLVIIPTYNEKTNISKIIDRVLQTIQTDILVVDDNSPDGTGKLVDEIAKDNSRVKIIHRPLKLGLGKAYLQGFEYALSNKYEFVFQMDADFSHDPKYLLEFVRKLESYDLVIGSRYVRGGKTVNWKLLRRLISKLGSKYAGLVLNSEIRDLTGGFKGFRSYVLEDINLKEVFSDGFCFQIEITYRALKKGFRIKEIPITFIDRTSGSSKMNSKIIIEALWKLLFMKSNIKN